MFYDERIENIKGKTAKNSIILSVIAAFAFDILRLINILKNLKRLKFLWLLSFETAVIVFGGICLIRGFILRKRTFADERREFIENEFYNKAFPILIKIVLLLYSIILPLKKFGVVTRIMSENRFVDMSIDSILAILLFTVGIYIIYSFKKNDIYFNYSLMDSEHYYKGVFKNIGKIALAMLAMLAVSIAVTVILLIFVKTPDNNTLFFILSMLIEYTVVFVEISALYLIYSVLEKASYDRKGLISKASCLSVLITLFLQAAVTAAAVIAEISSSTQTEAIKTVMQASYLTPCVLFALMIFLTYFKYEYKAKVRDGLFSVSCNLILISHVISFVFGYVFSAVRNTVIFELADSHKYSELFSLITIYSGELIGFVNTVGVVMLIIALIENKSLKIGNIAAIILIVLSFFIGIFVMDRGTYMTVNIYNSICKLAILIYLFAVIIYISKKRVCCQYIP